MSRLEEAVIRRFSGWTLFKWSLVLAVTGVSPLLLYILLGPRDGNPIGLGLLALAALLLSAAGAAVGLIKMMVERSDR